MDLNNDTYYSREAGRNYFSVSQYKDFCKCEAAAMARIRNEFEYPSTTSMLVGSYVDRFIEGSLDGFRQEHPEVFTKKGVLRAEFKKAEEVISLITSDSGFMKFLSGEKQKIITFDLLGVPWKMKMDSYEPGVCITDLKVVKDFESMPFWRYDIQGAVYQYGVEYATGERLPFYLAAVTKEPEPDHDIFQILQPTLDMAFTEVERNITRYAAVKAGAVKPKRCGKCAYCRRTKTATIRDYNELLNRD